MVCSQQWQYIQGYTVTECLGYCTEVLQKVVLLVNLQVFHHQHFSLETVDLLLSVILVIGYPYLEVCHGCVLEAIQNSWSSQKVLFLGFVSLHLLNRTILLYYLLKTYFYFS